MENCRVLEGDHECEMLHRAAVAQEHQGQRVPMLGDPTKHHLVGLMGSELLVDWRDVHLPYIRSAVTLDPPQLFESDRENLPPNTGNA